MFGVNPLKVDAHDLLNEAKDYVLIVKRNHKKKGNQHTGKYITISEGNLPIEKLLELLAASVTTIDIDADKNKRRIKKWLKEDLFHEELTQLFFAKK